MFRTVTVPLLAPVLTVVFVTMLINVLKVFDIVISIAPGSVPGRRQRAGARDVAHVVRRRNDFGTGSAIAVFIFLLVIPVLLLNVRRFRRSRTQMADSDCSADRTAAGGRSARTAQLSLAAAGADPPRARWSFGRALADPDDRPVRHLAAVSRPTSSRAGLVERSSRTPAKLTLDNYRACSTTRRSWHSLWTTVVIAVGGTAVPVDRRRAGRLRVRVARVPRPRLALHRRRRRCSSCRCRWR